MNDTLELISRSFGLENFDFDQPLFFSVTMDQRLVCLNLHWIANQADTNQRSFNLNEISVYPLKQRDRINTIRSAVNNIYDHFSDTHLELILDALH